MSNVCQDDLSRLRFDWPEPVLIELIGDRYDGAPADRLTPARLHARFLHELFEGRIRPAAALRIELISCCAARGITPATIEAADHAAFLELMGIIRTRFRNSPRLCLEAMQRLHAAIARLPKPSPDKPKPQRTAASERLRAWASAA